jgi:anaerobic ribonucleoside-triphosphate reductase activating protein
MRYAGIIYDDTTAAPGLCLTFFTQGCPIHCPGCHNPQTWNPDGGHEFTPEVLNHIVDGVVANGVTRNLCIMGCEPFAPYNIFLTHLVIKTVKENHPNVKVFIWTGYYLKDLPPTNPHIKAILEMTDCVIEGPFEIDKRDITLPMCGSSNQKVTWLTK